MQCVKPRVPIALVFAFPLSAHSRMWITVRMKRLMRFLIEALNQRGIAYLHLSDPDWAGGQPYTEAFRQKVRERFNGTIIGAGAYTREKAETLIEKGLIDAVAFGRDCIANPDLVERLRKKTAFNPQRPDYFYGGGAEGYIDYPTL